MKISHIRRFNNHTCMIIYENNEHLFIKNNDLIKKMLDSDTSKEDSECIYRFFQDLFIDPPFSPAVRKKVRDLYNKKA